MHKFIVISTALLSLHLASAEETSNLNPNPHFTVSFSSAVANKYLNTGTGGELSKDPVVQTDLTLTHRSGLYLDLWNSRSLAHKWNSGDLGDEVDYGIGWNGTVKGFNVHIGSTYFDEPNVFTLGAGDIVYTHARIGKDFKHLTITAGYENYTPLPGSGFQGGNLMSVGASRNFSFCKDKVSLATSLAGVYDTGTLGSDREFFARGNVGLNWNANKHLTLNLISANYFIRHTSDVMVMSGFTVNF